MSFRHDKEWLVAIAVTLFQIFQHLHLQMILDLMAICFAERNKAKKKEI